VETLQIRDTYSRQGIYEVSTKPLRKQCECHGRTQWHLSIANRFDTCRRSLAHHQRWETREVNRLIA
jgi:hypothetical protein